MAAASSSAGSCSSASVNFLMARGYFLGREELVSELERVGHGYRRGREREILLKWGRRKRDVHRRRSTLTDLCVAKWKHHVQASPSKQGRKDCRVPEQWTVIEEGSRGEKKHGEAGYSQPHYYRLSGNAMMSTTPASPANPFQICSEIKSRGSRPGGFRNVGIALTLTEAGI